MQTFTFVREVNRVAAVALLRSPGRPAAITGLIVATVIDPAERQAFGTQTDVGEEVLKSHPAFADSDAATAILWVRSRFGIEAAILHTSPGDISSRLLVLRRVLVRSVMIGMPTAAALHALELRAIDGFGVSRVPRP